MQLCARHPFGTIGEQINNGISDVFNAYQSVRREGIDKAYDESVFGWETQKDCSWFTFLLRTWITRTYLWWTWAARQKRYSEDVATMDLE